MSTPILRAAGIEKRYARVVALRGADLSIHAGECVGLIGDNGAGKSTLVKVLSGAVNPDAGELFLDGRSVSFPTPTAAREAGVETVYQDLALATSLGAATNIFLGRETVRPGLLGKLGFVDRQAMNARTRELLGGLSVKIQSLEYPVGQYSGGQRQAVAIARAITWDQRILILDEPTAALGVPQRKMVLELLDRLRAEHRELGIVLITHDIPNVFQATDRIVVMRQGANAAEFKTAEATEHELLAAMTGVAA